MRVSELAHRAGVNASAVRFYEEVGVLPLAARRANGYREYGAEDLARLRLVVSLRRLGLGPEDAGRLARLCLERGAMTSTSRRCSPTSARRSPASAPTSIGWKASSLDLELTIAAAGRVTNEGPTMSDAPIRVLFVCTGNSARSQLAEALLGQFGGSDFEVQSAGTEPKGVNPFAVEVLAKRGIDWSSATSKSVDLFLDRSFDYVITVCDRARQACPVFPGQHNSLHWGLDDPAEVDGTDDEKRAAFERIAMELTQRLRPFIEIALRAAGRTRRAAISG